jgi:hypothetical protein
MVNKDGESYLLKQMFFHVLLSRRERAAQRTRRRHKEHKGNLFVFVVVLRVLRAPKMIRD